MNGLLGFNVVGSTRQWRGPIGILFTPFMSGATTLASGWCISSPSVVSYVPMAVLLNKQIS